MQQHQYTVEELMLDDSFKSWCLSKDSGNISHWQTIIDDHPEQQEIFAQAKILIVSLNGGLSKTEVDRQIEKVRRMLLERGQNNGEAISYEPTLSEDFVLTDTGIVRRLSRRRIFSYAAAACIICLAGFTYFFLHSSTKDIQNHLAITSYQTPIGKRQTIRLPDGSDVILNSNSSISYTTEFNKNKREITLKGDAFFKVAKNHEKPFIVTSGNIATTALGTEFLVHAHQSLSVELLEGRVKVESLEKNGSASEVILNPGDKAEMMRGKQLTKTTFDSSYLRTWIDGTISFTNTPVPGALSQLQKWYDVEIKVNAKNLEGQSISGHYNSASLEDILKVICFSINKHYTISENTITIQ